MLLPMGDKKLKAVTNAVNNPKCRNILDLLAEKGKATESEIAKELDAPISTVHYNLKQLVNAGLVVADEYHYSKKGREVNHYRMANRYIIITPGETKGIRQKLASILPAALISVVAGVMIKYLYAPESKSVAESGPMMAVRSAPPSAPDLALWFLAGAAFFLVVFLLWNYLRDLIKE